MKAADVKVGTAYAVRVTGRVVPVRIERAMSYDFGGWYGTNLLTGRCLRIWSAGRLLREAYNVGGGDHA